MASRLPIVCLVSASCQRADFYPMRDWQGKEEPPLLRYHQEISIRKEQPMSFARTVGLMAILVGIALTATSQELPIAVDNDDTFSGGGTFDGTNYCLLIQGDNTSPYSITAQFISRA